MDQKIDRICLHPDKLKKYTLWPANVESLIDKYHKLLSESVSLEFEEKHKEKWVQDENRWFNQNVDTFFLLKYTIYSLSYVNDHIHELIVIMETKRGMEKLQIVRNGLRRIALFKELVPEYRYGSKW